jgi:hypothetical protein
LAADQLALEHGHGGIAAAEGGIADFQIQTGEGS